jgi:transposase
MDGLRMQPGRGRRPYITVEQKEQLKTDLTKSPETFGYKTTANRSGQLLKKHLETTCGTDYKQAAAYVLLHNLEFSFQRVRGKYPERDETRREQAKSDIKNFSRMC